MEIHNLMNIIKRYLDIPAYQSLLTVFSLAAVRYAYLHKDKLELEISFSWEELSENNSGDYIHLMIDDLASQIPQIKIGMDLLSIDSILSILPELITCLGEMDFPEDSSDLLEGLLDLELRSNFKRGGIYEPKELNIITTKILNIKGNASLYGCITNYGRVLVEAVKLKSSISIYAIDTNAQIIGIGQLYLFMSGVKNFDLRPKETINVLNNELNTNQKFDYVISYPPFGYKLNYEVHTKYGSLKKDATIGFVIHAIESLKEDGKAIVTVTNSLLFQGSITGDIRKRLVEEDLIEAVITLPSGFYVGTSLPISIMVFNKNKSEERKGKIQIIDATSFGTRNRGITKLSTKDIDDITDYYYEFREDNKICKVLNLSDIKDNNFNLLPTSYLQIEEVNSIIGEVEVNRSLYEEEVFTTPLKNLAEIYRGINTVNNSDSDTIEAKLIQLSDVNKGEIHLDKVKKYLIRKTVKEKDTELKTNDVIISSRGIAMKVAIVPDINKEEPHYLSANFIGLRPLPGVNPNFLLAFFESPIGESYIRALRKGVMLPILNLKDMNNIPIPKLSKKEMNEIGDSYLQALFEYNKAINFATQNYVESLQAIYETSKLKIGYEKH